MKKFSILILSLVLGPFVAEAGDPVPGIVGEEVVLHEDFEGSTTVMDETLEGSRSSVVTSPDAFNGVRCLEMHNSGDGKFSRRFDLNGSYDALYARYMFRVGNAGSPCWDSGQKYKLMGFEGGTSECKGGDYVSDGTDCFSARGRFEYPNLGYGIEGYGGIVSDSNVGRPGITNDVNERVDVSDGNWHCFEYLIKLNTPGQRDGEVRYWVDGDEIVHPNLMFRTVDTLKIDKWWFTYWANDDWCGALYIDDLIISQVRIGCPGSTPDSDTVGPAPPSNLRVVSSDG